MLDTQKDNKKKKKERDEKAPLSCVGGRYERMVSPLFVSVCKSFSGVLYFHFLIVFLGSSVSGTRRKKSEILTIRTKKNRTNLRSTKPNDNKAKRNR